MEQKIIWMLFLIIGLTTKTGCKKKVDYQVTTTYFYENNTEHSIKMSVYCIEDASLIVEYSISSYDTLSFKIEADGGAGPFQYDTHVGEQGDSIVLLFDNERYLTYPPHTARSVLDHGNYKREDIGNTLSNMYYTFTEDDYNNAESIK